MGKINKVLLIAYLISLSTCLFGDQGNEASDACVNSSFCENTTIADFAGDDIFENINIKELATSIFKFPDNTKTTSTTESSIDSEVDLQQNLESSKIQEILEERSKNKFCGCDLTTSVCDINCCCDLDCTEYHYKVFSTCVDREIEKEKDTWYCRDKPFFRKNDTRFILEKVADSLFCIASDNLPPVYSATSHLQIEDEKSFKKVIDNNKPSRFKWKLDAKKIDLPEYNITNSYKYADALWKIHRNSLQLFELPQTGFGEECDFRKTVKFLEDWKSSCHQVYLNNKNAFLFPANFSQINVLAQPLKFNPQHLLTSCPKNVCQTANASYCAESWTSCKTNKTVQGFCTENVCNNVAKKVRYVIFHNGSEGIKHIEVYFQLANVKSSFKQEIEVQYKWVNLNRSLIFERSGNPGYIGGKPIFIGTQVSNKTGEVEEKYIVFNKTRQHLTLPIADKSGICSEVDRYPVKFLENIKLRCSVVVKSNFSTSACIKLQNHTFEAIIDFMTLKRFEKPTFDRQFVSKTGNVFDNDTNSWAKMFIDKVPQNVITAQLLENEIQCSGIVTSVAFNIVHSLMSKPGINNNHVILGVGVTFSDEVDLKWPKCTGRNCQETLQLELVSFVSFHDVSRPTRYHIAGGPNLDISLPYDFFYPFLSHSKSHAPFLYNYFSFKASIFVCLILMS
ncbi:tectonic-3 [Phymastichus coffea]|uniref:tectonic-3 n=1 Tax=Phymastichus coffea TaxID=108790 RepID=UPI00273B650D|nr:tectonic-3 [Phymastichus coffea]